MYVSGCSTHCLNEGPVSSEESFFVCIKNGYESYLRKVEALSQEIDANEYIELPLAKLSDNLDPFHRPDIRMKVSRLDSCLYQILT